MADYYRNNIEECEDIEERYSLMLDRIKELADENEAPESYRGYFTAVAEFILKTADVLELVKTKAIDKMSKEELAALNNEEQAKVLSTGAVKTNEIKQAVAELKEPSNKDIELAYHHITSGLNMKKYVPGSVFENYLKDRCGRTHQYYGGTGLSFDCSLRGVAINRRKEITWHDFVSRAENLGLYKPYDYVTESDTKNEPAEQLPGQDSIQTPPE